MMEPQPGRSPKTAPNHCELNTVALVWADLKGHMARNNTTLKFYDVKNY